MQVSPFYANYGFNPHMGVEPHRMSKVEAVEDFAKRMQHIHEEAQAALSKARDEMKHYADQHQSEVPEYKVGQKVWVETDNIDLKRPSKKLAERRIGPYEILEIISPNAIKLKLPRTVKLHPVMNVSQLRPYKEPRITGQEATPAPPVEINGELEYEVKQILDS